MRGNHENQKSRHHMIPRSRGGSDKIWNIKIIRQKEHDAWHLLFGNKTPEEIVEYIREEWTPRRGNNDRSPLCCPRD